MTTTASSGHSNNDSNDASRNSSNINVMPVSSMMAQDVKTVREDQTILDVCRVMHNHNIGSVVVVAGRETKDPSLAPSSSPSSSVTSNVKHRFDEPAGIITERDIVRHIAIKLIAIQAPVSDVMSKPVVTVRPETSLAEAIQIMQSRNFRRLVVVDNNRKLLGIITDKDILRAIARNPALVSELLSAQQPLPSSLATDKDLLDQLRMGSLGELFQPKRG